MDGMKGAQATDSYSRYLHDKIREGVLEEGEESSMDANSYGWLSEREQVK